MIYRISCTFYCVRCYLQTLVLNTIAKQTYMYSVRSVVSVPAGHISTYTLQNAILVCRTRISLRTENKGNNILLAVLDIYC